MKSILICVTISTLILCACTPTHTSGRTWGAGLFRGTSPQEYSAFLHNFDAWLKSRGLVPNTPPKWVRYSYKVDAGNRVITFEVLANDKTFEITANSSYGGKYTEKELALINSTSLKLWTDVFHWVTTQKQVNEIMIYSPRWIPDMIASVHKTFQQKTEQDAAANP